MANSDNLFAALRAYIKGNNDAPNDVLSFDEWKALDKETKWRVAKVYEMASDLRLAHLPKDIGTTAVLLKNLILRTSIELKDACCYYSVDNLATAYKRYYTTIREALKALRSAGVVDRYSLGEGKGYAHFPVITHDMLDLKGTPPSDFIEATRSEPGAWKHPVRGSTRCADTPEPGAFKHPGPGASTLPKTPSNSDSKSKTAKGEARKRAKPPRDEKIDFGEVSEPTRLLLDAMTRIHRYKGGDDPKTFARLLDDELRVNDYTRMDTLQQTARIIATERKFFPTIMEIVEAYEEAEFRLRPVYAKTTIPF